jgi:5'-nucleotidase
MSNDARFGLVVGVTLVIAVAIVFFRKEQKPRVADATETASRPEREPAPPPVPPGPTAHEPVPGAVEPPPPVAPSGLEVSTPLPSIPVAEKRHVISEGDTLFSLATEYYGNVARFNDIYQANRDVLFSPERLPVGAAIRIP